MFHVFIVQQLYILNIADSPIWQLSDSVTAFETGQRVACSYCFGAFIIVNGVITSIGAVGDAKTVSIFCRG